MTRLLYFRAASSVLFSVLLSACGGSNELRPASVFADHMVLQCDRPVPIWGWAAPDSEVTVTLGSHSASARADVDGRWILRLNGLPADSEPSALVIESRAGGDSSTERVRIEDVLVGEVWLCSGQSNMEMPLLGYKRGQHVLGSEAAIANSTRANLRLCSVLREISREPRDDCSVEWVASSPPAASTFSAVGYSFATELQRTLDVPVGIINSSWAATAIQAWTDRETLERIGGVDFDKVPEGKKFRHNIPTAVYNGMIRPLIPFAMRGVIWYQGESNIHEPEQYAKIFPAMIRSWRSQWGQGDTPFYFVQLAPYEYGGQHNSALIRDVQHSVMRNVPNTGMVSTLDIGDEERIHPPEKLEVGRRLALWALAETYGREDVAYSGPAYKSMKIEGDRVLLEFDHVLDGISPLDEHARNFTVAGADRVFHPAKVKVMPDQRVAVWSDAVPHPVAARYGWSNWVKGDLSNSSGLPAPSFRTDDW